MIKFDGYNGPILVNAEKIVSFSFTNRGAQLITTAGSHHIKEDKSEVIEKINILNSLKGDK